MRRAAQLSFEDAHRTPAPGRDLTVLPDAARVEEHVLRRAAPFVAGQLPCTLAELERGLLREARAAGLGVTIHVGEEGGDVGRAEVGEVVEALRPDRIGHGILAARDSELMETLRSTQIVLEICPTSNLLTKALESEEAVRETFRAFTDNGVLLQQLHRGDRRRRD